MDPVLLFQPLANRRASAAPETTSGSPPAATVDTLPPAAFAPAASSAGLVPPGPGAALSGFTGGLGGGLASSPNVPVPGTSINPDTGLPHTAGLTRAELQAQKARAEEGRRLSELSGRQQAAAQLLGPGAVGLNDTPASPTSQHSVIDDVTNSISKLGHKTYDALPAAVKDVFAEPKGKGVEGTPVKPRRGSAAALFDNVKSTASRLSHDLQETVSNAMAEPAVDGQSQAARRGSFLANGEIQARTVGNDTVPSISPTTRRTSTIVSNEPGVLQQVKGFLQDAFSTDPSPLRRESATLPSQENQGARPGEVSAGAGALPGKFTEAGVAVLPDVREQEGTAGGKITTAAPLPLPTPVNAPRDAGPFGAAPFTSTSGEKSGLETALDDLSVKAKNFISYAASAAAGAGGMRADFKDEPFGAAKGDAIASSAFGSTMAPPTDSTLAPTDTKAALTASEAAKGDSTKADSDIGSTGLLAAAAAAAAGAAGTTAAIKQEPSVTQSNVDKAVIGDTGVHNKVESLNASHDLAPPISTSSTGALGETPSGVPTSGVTSAGALGAPSSEGLMTASEKAAGEVTPPSTAPVQSSDTARDVPPVNDRTDSLASVTAIRHGHSGDLHGSSPLATVTSASANDTTTVGGASDGVKNVTSLTPGNEQDGIGHPSTRDTEGATRKVGSYPAAQHGDADKSSAASDSHSQGKSTTTPPSDKEHNDKHLLASPGGQSHLSGTTLSASPHSPNKTLSTNGAANASVNADASKTNEQGHRRNSSSASNDSKKVGFMKKLKGEMKVISGKLGGNEEKVQLGEKIKHGEA